MKINTKLNYRKGFSLVEMLVVITIIVVLISLVSAGLFAAKQAARKKTNETIIQQISASIDEFRLDEGVFPIALNSNGENIQTLQRTLSEGYDATGMIPPGNNGRHEVYVKEELLDVFGEELHYLDRATFETTFNPDFDLWSSGANRVSEYPLENEAGDLINAEGEVIDDPDELLNSDDARNW